MKLSGEELIKFFNEKTNGEFILEEYTTFSGKAKIKHISCGFEFEIKGLNHWLIACSCPACSKGGKINGFEAVRKRIEAMYGKERFTFLEIPDPKTVRSKTKLLINDNLCNHPPFYSSWDKLRSGQTCPKCGNRRSGLSYKRLTTEEIRRRMLDDPFFKNYEVLNLEDYVNIHEKNIKVKCLNCGTIKTTTIFRFVYQKNGCTNCRNNSKSELAVIKFLEKRNISYSKHNYNLISPNKQLEIDFVININEKEYWLEMNGEFHYPNCAFFKNSKEDQEALERRDKEKVNFAINNKKNFIVIPFWSFKDINTILSEIFFNNSTTKELDYLLIENGILKKDFVLTEEKRKLRSRFSLKNSDDIV